ncbi:unnamed protein product [Effrenium voratum]|uniref:Uncharacterized protein n=1 Tax=Effrenium voratum TaxID=2562239 RepID=A0AA36IIV0_9DINO|nr:unnamed protein product [Effrenium voratum]
MASLLSFSTVTSAQTDRPAVASELRPKLLTRSDLAREAELECLGQHLAGVSAGKAMSGAWAFSWQDLAVQLRGEPLVAAPARKAFKGLSSQTSQGPTNIAQASGRLAARGAALSEALGEEVTGRVEELCPQGIANAARSFGTAQSASAKVYEALAGRLTEDPSAQNLANAARTRAAAKLCDRQVFAAIADHAIQKISEFQSQGPANLARWLARTALSSRPSLRAAARRAEQVMDTLDPQNSSNAARAPATLEAFDRPLMAAAAAEAIRQMGAFRPQHLANLGWRPGSLRESRWEPAARAMAERGAELCHEFDPQGTANQVWAFGRPG